MVVNALKCSRMRHKIVISITNTTILGTFYRIKLNSISVFPSKCSEVQHIFGHLKNPDYHQLSFQTFGEVERDFWFMKKI